MHKQRDIFDTNRDMKMKSRIRSAWCACDMFKVRDGEKCPLCHRRNPRRRLKKGY